MARINETHFILAIFFTVGILSFSSWLWPEEKPSSIGISAGSSIGSQRYSSADGAIVGLSFTFELWKCTENKRRCFRR